MSEGRLLNKGGQTQHCMEGTYHSLCRMYRLEKTWKSESWGETNSHKLNNIHGGIALDSLHGTHTLHGTHPLVSSEVMSRGQTSELEMASF